jgi:hypothetical protein
MIPTTGQVYDAVRGAVGDTQISNGQVFTDTFLLRPLNLAWDDLLHALRRVESSRLQREILFLLPPYYGSISPASFNIFALDQPISLFSRKITSALTITNAIADSSNRFVTVTVSAPHGLIDGKQVDVVEVKGISDDVNQNWYVTIPTTTTLQLNGCSATGTYQASTGRVIIPNGAWPLDSIYKSPYPSQIPDAATEDPTCWCYQNNRLFIQPCSVQREFKLYYELGDGDIPAGSTIPLPIEGAKNYLTFQTSVYALAGKTESSKISFWQTKAAEALDHLKSSAIKDLQVNSTRIISTPFGSRKRVPSL